MYVEIIVFYVYYNIIFIKIKANLEATDDEGFYLF